MTKEQFLNNCEHVRRGFLTAIQCGLTVIITPALLVLVFILWIEEIKTDKV